MFTLTAPNAYTLTMTRTGDAAVGSFDGSVTVAQAAVDVERVGDFLDMDGRRRPFDHFRLS